MPVRKQRRPAESPADGVGDAEPDLVVVDVGVDKFLVDLVVARLESEGIKTGSWGSGLEARYGHLNSGLGYHLLVRREDLPAVDAALSDAAPSS